jgi:hypothetical protein
MLGILFGSQSIQKILLFLFVNGQTYATQLHHALQTPLTPLQKALQRLEKGGVLCSFYEGKTRLYRFNPTYPLLEELELMLKKAYTLLPAAEKRLYYGASHPSIQGQNGSASHVEVLLRFWAQLATVCQLTCNVKNRSPEEQGQYSKGRGEVSVSSENDRTLIFHEKGVWQGGDNGEITFSNSYRWTLDRLGGVIALEHLRRGVEHAVFLFHLAPSGAHSLASVDSHLCGGDSYFGRIHFDKRSIRLHWRVIGPRKNGEIDTFYC